CQGRSLPGRDGTQRHRGRLSVGGGDGAPDGAHLRLPAHAGRADDGGYFQQAGRALAATPANASRQLVEALAEALQAHRETDAFLRGLENDEGRGLAGAQLLHQVLVHDDLGDAAVRQAAYETSPPDVRLVDLEPQP